MRTAVRAQPVTALCGNAAHSRLRSAFTRLRRAEEGGVDARTLNRLADEVLAARIMIFDATVARGWIPSAEQAARRRRDAALIEERGDGDV